MINESTILLFSLFCVLFFVIKRSFTLSKKMKNRLSTLHSRTSEKILSRKLRDVKNLRSEKEHTKESDETSLQERKNPEIPFDCWGVILEFLNCQEDVMNVFVSIESLRSYVFTYNAGCCRNINKKIEYSSYNGANKLSKKKKKKKPEEVCESKVVRNISIIFPSSGSQEEDASRENFFNSTVGRFTKMETLKLERSISCENPFHRKVWSLSRLEKIPLRYLKFTNLNMSLVLPAFRHLEVLIVKFSGDIKNVSEDILKGSPDQHVNSILTSSKLPKLRKLKISNGNYLSMDKHMKSEHIPHLKEMKLSSNTHSQNEGPISFSSNSLSSLKLYKVDNIISPSNFHNLKKFSLRTYLDQLIKWVDNIDKHQTKILHSKEVEIISRSTPYTPKSSYTPETLSEYIFKLLNGFCGVEKLYCSFTFQRGDFKSGYKNPLVLRFGSTIYAWYRLKELSLHIEPSYLDEEVNEFKCQMIISKLPNLKNLKVDSRRSYYVLEVSKSSNQTEVQIENLPNLEKVEIEYLGNAVFAGKLAKLAVIKFRSIRGNITLSGNFDALKKLYGRLGCEISFIGSFPSLEKISIQRIHGIRSPIVSKILRDIPTLQKLSFSGLDYVEFTKAFLTPTNNRTFEKMEFCRLRNGALSFRFDEGTTAKVKILRIVDISLKRFPFHFFHGIKCLILEGCFEDVMEWRKVKEINILEQKIIESYSETLEVLVIQNNIRKKNLKIEIIFKSSKVFKFKKLKKLIVRYPNRLLLVSGLKNLEELELEYPSSKVRIENLKNLRKLKFLDSEKVPIVSPVGSFCLKNLPKLPEVTNERNFDVFRVTKMKSTRDELFGSRRDYSGRTEEYFIFR